MREALLLAALCWMLWPLWAVPHPPIQDLPQHLAAVRVLHDYHDPALRFSEYFSLSLGSTQYLAVYLVADALAYLVNVRTALLIVLSVSLLALPYAMRWLLRAAGRDEWLCLWTLPFLWSAHVLLGFLNFVAALPLMLCGLALAFGIASRRSNATEPPLAERARLSGRGWALALVSLLCFFTHIVPAAFLVLGAALLLVRGPRRELWQRMWPLLPVVLGGLLWALATHAGRSVLAALGLLPSPAGMPAPLYDDWARAVELIPRWLTEVLKTREDERLLWIVGWLACLSAVIAWRWPAKVTESLRATIWLAPLPVLAAVAYFWLPEAHDWIWPINGRMPLLCVLLALPLLPSPPGWWGRAFGALVLVVALRGAWLVGNAFRVHERALEGFDACVEQVPQGARVAGLIFDAGSTSVQFAPLLHAAAWVQAEKGGVAMFTFADFPQSPFRFREDHRPPRVPPRWEWMPQRVQPDRDLLWYDFVLVRRGPGVIQRARHFRLVQRIGDWSLWQRLPTSRQDDLEDATGRP